MLYIAYYYKYFLWSCFLFIFSPYYNREDRRITVFVLGFCVVDVVGVVSEILVAIIPWILVSYEIIYRFIKIWIGNNNKNKYN